CEPVVRHAAGCAPASVRSTPRWTVRAGAVSGIAGSVLGRAPGALGARPGAGGWAEVSRRAAAGTGPGRPEGPGRGRARGGAASGGGRQRRQVARAGPAVAGGQGHVGACGVLTAVLDSRRSIVRLLRARLRAPRRCPAPR